MYRHATYLFSYKFSTNLYAMDGSGFALHLYHYMYLGNTFLYRMHCILLYRGRVRLPEVPGDRGEDQQNKVDPAAELQPLPPHHQRQDHQAVEDRQAAAADAEPEPPLERRRGPPALRRAEGPAGGQGLHGGGHPPGDLLERAHLPHQLHLRELGRRDLPLRRRPADQRVESQLHRPIV